ncbi:MAG: hypothetical protein IKI41_01100 [Clostridia bacterium]|nr:hypothetical protein [Clostridia bacterium]
MKEKKAKKNKGGKILLTVILVILAVAAVYSFFCLAAGRLFYPDFYKSATRVAKIPSMTKGFIPQGCTAFEGDTNSVVCGYMQGKGSSRLYVFDEKGRSREVILEREDGSEYGGHAGGITASGNYLYISNASKLFVLDRNEVMNARDGDTVAFKGHVEVPCRASFCSSDGKYVYVGDFHADGYETEEDHTVKTSDGGEYHALVFAYELDNDGTGTFGLKDPEHPALVYSVCDKVQGFAVTAGGSAILSCSFSLKPSELRIYNVAGENDSEFTYNGSKIPMKILDSKRFVKTVKAPHMSEDVDFRGGKLLVCFEGGAKKYGGGIIPFSLFDVFALDLESLKG